jgi:hypothetical protein
MTRAIVLLASVFCLTFAACGEDNPCSSKDPSCSFEGCSGDGDCSNDQVCYQRNGSGYGVRCEKDCDVARSYCAASSAAQR